MTRQTQNMAASVHARLLNRSRERGEDFNFVLQRYAAERFLYRLGQSAYRELYVLKGAMLFALWGDSIYRATRDLDFTGYGSSETASVLTCFREICMLPVEDDGLVFDAATLAAESIRDDSEYDGLRVRFLAILGTARISMQIDVGFGNAIQPPAVDVKYPTLLDAPAPHIRAYPHEAVIAEKLHCMVVLGERSSRLKDIYDLHVFAKQFPFDGVRLAGAIAATFERRRTPIDAWQPAALAPRFFADDARAGQWRTYLDRNRLPGAPADFVAVGEFLRAFLGPVWSAMAEKAAFDSKWRPGGPWGFKEAKPRYAMPASTATRPAESELQPTLDGREVVPMAIEGPAGIALCRYKPYPKYKDSGVEWLGDIPEHWEIKKIKRLCLVRRGASPRPIEDPVYFDDEGEYSWVRIADVTASDRYLYHTTQKLSSLGKSKSVPLEPGELFLTIAATVGKPIITKIRCCIHDGFVYFVGLKEHREFLYYLFNCGEAYKGLGKLGTQLNLNTDTIGDIYVPVPPLQEQDLIVKYLDRKTAKIDVLVAKKERLIQLLQEKRTTIITRAVTKGLDPNVPMKDSGVEWLGEIPAHWELTPLKWCVLSKAGAIKTGPFGSQLLSSEMQGSEVKVYNQRTVIERDFRVGENYISRDKFQDLSAFAVFKGDILVTTRGTIGRCAVVPEEAEEGILHPCLMRVQPDPKRLQNEYLALLVQDSNLVQVQLVLASNATTIDVIYSDTMSRILLPRPPLNEQTAITSFLECETAKIDALVGRIREVIERLKEYRTALISAAVTGKIDIREEGA